ncbi:MAG: hypothetical protein J3Q66DRAFT_354807 [Benniella sp.]|nr:MAG: hypothetical protein J3Q66DRAFT_354807 [Benniella sp.]
MSAITTLSTNLALVSFTSSCLPVGEVEEGGGPGGGPPASRHRSTSKGCLLLECIPRDAWCSYKHLYPSHPL